MATESTRPQRKRLPHLAPHWVGEGATFFVTVCGLPRGLNQFCLPDRAPRLLETVQFRHQRGTWYCFIFLMMPDHIHTLVALEEPGELKTVVSQWKAITAKTCGIRWQTDFFDHRLRSDEQWELKARYIEENPVRKGLIPCPQDWPFVWRPEV